MAILWFAHPQIKNLPKWWVAGGAATLFLVTRFPKLLVVIIPIAGDPVVSRSPRVAARQMSAEPARPKCRAGSSRRYSAATSSLAGMSPLAGLAARVALANSAILTTVSSEANTKAAPGK